MFSKQYWEERVRKYGHTGHGEPFFYCFDQEARKFAIEELLKELPFNRKQKALDFGCGSGDLIAILSEYFEKVSGFDISENVLKIAEKRYAGQAGITLSNKTSDLATSGFDLILTVTVLQCLSPEELKQNLVLLRQLLSKDGYMLCMEFFTTEEYNKALNENKSTLKDWFSSVKANGLSIVAEKHFYNPFGAKALSFHGYRRDPLVMALKPLKRFSYVRKLLSERARKIIHSKRDILGDQNSIFKVYILQAHAH